MFRSKRAKKGQNTAEYAILIALIIGVAVAMQTYVKRGMQGRVHDASNMFYDEVAKETSWAGINDTAITALTSKQYEPEGLSSQSTQDIIKDEVIYTMIEDGTVTRDITQETTQAAGDYQEQDY